MAAPTSRSFDITFHCLYPIELDHEWALQFYFHRIDRFGSWKKVRGIDPATAPLLAHYTNVCYLDYNCLYYPGKWDSCNALLKEYTEEDGFSYLPGFGIDTRASGYGLFFDVTVRIFYIHFVLTLSSDRDYREEQAPYFRELYGRVRNMLVEDDIYEKPVSRWAREIKTRCVETVRAELEARFQAAPEVSIQKSLGYLVSFFPGFSEFAAPGFPEDFLSRAHSLDKVEQQVEKMKGLSVYRPGAFAFPGWQASTLWGIDAETCTCLLPVFINIQNMYYTMTRPVKFHINNLYDQIFYQDNIRLNRQINRSERLSLLLHKLKHSERSFLANQKPYQQQLHREIWDYWDLEDDFSTYERDLERCRQSLDQKAEILKTQADNRQNNLLFVIAILQLSALISVANDYFDLNSKVGTASVIVLLSLAFLTTVTLLVGYIDRIKLLFRRKKRRK